MPRIYRSLNAFIERLSSSSRFTTSVVANISHDDELIDITKTDWFRKMEANHHPGITIRVYRTNRGWTLAELADKTGIAESHLSAIENRKRGVGKVTATRLGKAFGMDYRRFL